MPSPPWAGGSGAGARQGRANKQPRPSHHHHYHCHHHALPHQAHHTPLTTTQHKVFQWATTSLTASLPPCTKQQCFTPLMLPPLAFFFFDATPHTMNHCAPSSSSYARLIRPSRHATPRHAMPPDDANARARSAMSPVPRAARRYYAHDARQRARHAMYTLCC